MKGAERKDAQYSVALPPSGELFVLGEDVEAAAMPLEEAVGCMVRLADKVPLPLAIKDEIEVAEDGAPEDGEGEVENDDTELVMMEKNRGASSQYVASVVVRNRY